MDVCILRGVIIKNFAPRDAKSVAADWCELKVGSEDSREDSTPQ